MPLRADEFAANIKHLFIPNKYTSNFSSIFSWVGNHQKFLIFCRAGACLGRMRASMPENVFASPIQRQKSMVRRTLN